MTQPSALLLQPYQPFPIAVLLMIPFKQPFSHPPILCNLPNPPTQLPDVALKNALMHTTQKPSLPPLLQSNRPTDDPWLQKLVQKPTIPSKYRWSDLVIGRAGGREGGGGRIGLGF